MPDWLRARFTEAGDAPAIVWHDEASSYRWLLERAAQFAAELEARGVSRGSVVALESDYCPDACALLIALIGRENVVVPLTSDTRANRDRLFEISRVRHAVRLLPDGGREYARLSGGDHLLLARLAASRDAGLVLFTSGSTGEPKAALHSFSRLLEKYRSRRPARRTLTFLLLDHIGGINTLFHVLSNAGSIVTVGQRSPDAICAAIERHRVELLPTTPTFLNLLLLSEAIGRHDLSSLRQITYGTEPMPASTLERLHAALPQVRLSQTYGLSELGILRARSAASDSLWVELGGEGVETEVRDGILWIRSPSAMLGYLNAPSPFDAEGWFNTQDEVETDGSAFRIRGRRSEIINVGGEKVYPAEVESVLLELANVRDVAVRGQSNPITGQIVVARVNLTEPESLDSLRRRVREHCRSRLSPFKVPARVEIADEDQFSSRFKKTRLDRSPEDAP
ncbi:MAG TPA: long-chain fatty acid--CoA ligase [Thermoanaerobaculia bacterium]|jgi:long-chain acyl-CoA synthetase|nr:long-chain fatty acid--CoA ligase [Thermoanaerobaculia bacterium]